MSKMREYTIKNSVVFDQIYNEKAFTELDVISKLTKLDNRKIYNVYDILDQNKNDEFNSKIDKAIDIKNITIVFTYSDYSFYKFAGFSRRKEFFFKPIKNVFSEKLDLNKIINIDLAEVCGILNNAKYMKLKDAFNTFTKKRNYINDDNSRIKMIRDLAKWFVNSEYFIRYVFKDFSVIRSEDGYKTVSIAETIFMKTMFDMNTDTITKTKTQKRI